MPKYFDFTISIEEDMPSIPSGGRADVFSKPQLKVTHTIEREGWLSEELTITTHAGTHIDYPAHMMKEGRNADAYSLGDLIGPGVVLDIPKGELGGVTAEDLEKAAPAVEPGDIVFVNTGWWKRWAPYSDKAMNDYVTWKHAGITLEGAKWLLERKVKAVGIDANSVHPQGTSNESSPEESVHYALLSRGIPIVESLTNLDSASGRRGRVFIVPLPIRKAGGTLVRAFMEVDE